MRPTDRETSIGRSQSGSLNRRCPACSAATSAAASAGDGGERACRRDGGAGARRRSRACRRGRSPVASVPRDRSPGRDRPTAGVPGVPGRPDPDGRPDPAGRPVSRAVGRRDGGAGPGRGRRRRTGRRGSRRGRRTGRQRRPGPPVGGGAKVPTAPRRGTPPGRFGRGGPAGRGPCPSRVRRGPPDRGPSDPPAPPTRWPKPLRGRCGAAGSADRRGALGAGAGRGRRSPRAGMDSPAATRRSRPTSWGSRYRHWPTGRPRSVTGPTATRVRLMTLWPSFASIRRTSRFLPSARTSSIVVASPC